MATSTTFTIRSEGVSPALFLRVRSVPSGLTAAASTLESPPPPSRRSRPLQGSFPVAAKVASSMRTGGGKGEGGRGNLGAFRLFRRRFGCAVLPCANGRPAATAVGQKVEMITARFCCFCRAIRWNITLKRELALREWATRKPYFVTP